MSTKGTLAQTGTQGAAVSPKWAILAIVATAQLMIVLDASVVNVALPHAQQALGFSDSARQWVLTAYTLTFGGLLLLGGRIADYFGRRRMFIIGLIGFAAASALGGAAQSSAWLFGARAVQGVFAAVLAPAVLSLITTTFTGPLRAGIAFLPFPLGVLVSTVIAARTLPMLGPKALAAIGFTLDAAGLMWLTFGASYWTHVALPLMGGEHWHGPGFRPHVLDRAAGRRPVRRRGSQRPSEHHPADRRLAGCRLLEHRGHHRDGPLRPHPMVGPRQQPLCTASPRPLRSEPRDDAGGGPRRHGTATVAAQDDYAKGFDDQRA